MKVFKPISNKVLVEGAIDTYNKRIEMEAQARKDEDIARSKAFKESEAFIAKQGSRFAAQKRFASYSESVTHALLSECIYHVFKNSMRKELLEQENVTAMMRAMVGEFVKEDSADILYKMRNKTATLSEMYNLITSTKKTILENVDQFDPSSFRIDREVKDNFFEKLDLMDTESIENAIRERVTNAVDDFMTANKQDHDRIMGALQMTKDKLEEVKNEPEEVKESYQRISKQYIGKVRNRKKSVFESMVSAMCESVMKDDVLKEQYSEGAKLNIGKIVDRIETMYTFIECVNTMKLYDVDEAYMKSVIDSLRK